MKARCIFASALLLFGFLPTNRPLHAGEAKHATTMWKPAEGWKLDMEQFPRPGSNDLSSARYVVRTSVSGKSTIGGVDCWNVAFLFGEDAPPHLQDRYSLSVAKDSGWSMKIQHTRVLKRVPMPMLAASTIALGQPLNSLGIVGTTPMLKVGYFKATEQPHWLDQFGDASFVTAAPDGYPIEVIPPITGSFVSARTGAVLKVRSENEGGFRIVEANITVGSVEKLLVRQKWIDGEKWWREYERHVDGRKDLHARQIMPVPFKSNMPPVEPGKPDPLYLRRDPKLQVVVAIEERGAKLPVLFERIHKATGLLLTVDPSLANHQPDLGSVQAGPTGYRACDVMYIIERAQLESGLWVKTANGYKLTGVSKVRQPPEDGVLPGKAIPPSRSNLGWVIAGISVGLVLLVAGGILMFRRSRPRSEANSKSDAKSKSQPNR